MNSRSLRYLVTASGFLAFIGLAMNCAAQNASLTGVVKDAQGGIVPNTVISLVDLGKQVAVKTLTNQTGSYEFLTLRPGKYELKAEAAGFQISTVSPIDLEVDQRGRADIVLSVTGAAASIEVSAAGVSAVDTESSYIGDVIGSKTISEIPLNGRFFLDLAVLVPGSVVQRQALP
ncbi:MAG: hypothetical protein QOJ99_2196 [Bryobacterales bacterium]|nr:hypothetical protein [Bryobacterales bacterium]